MNRSPLAFVLLVGLGRAAFGAEVGFTKPPTAAMDGDTVAISFAVASATDVEVAVLDARGRVVRHLAAGVLGGPKAPPPPLQAGLAQSLAWDGRDDFGRKAAGGPFRVRVRAGTGAKFGRLIGGDPYTFGALVGLAADEEGRVYVLGFDGVYNQRHMTLRVFDPEGRYLRELIPFPADLAPDAMKDVARWDGERKTFRLRTLKNLNPDFYGGGRGNYLRLVSASVRNGIVLTDGARIHTLDVSGAVRGDTFLTATLWEKKHIPWGHVQNSGRGPVCLAVGPDGRHAYLAGPFTSKTRYGHKMQPNFPPGRVFRMALGGGDTMKEFVTVEVDHKEGVGGRWTKGMGYEFSPNGPVHGRTADAKGRVYVCDREHGRLAVYDEGGTLVGEVPVAYPSQVAVHPATGAVYVMQKDRVGYRHYHAKLFKFAKLGRDEAPAATFQLGPETRRPLMALSVSKERTVVWVAGTKEGLVALEDKGDAFEPRTTHYAPRPGAQLDWNRLAVDYARDEVYVSDGGTQCYRYDGATGEGGLLVKNGKPFHLNDLAVGYHGNLYVRVSGIQDGSASFYSGPFWRLNRALDPVPYAATGSHVLSPYIYSRYGIGTAERGIGVGPDGTAYLSFMYAWVQYCVAGFGPDGKALKGKRLEGEVGVNAEKQRAKYPKELTSAILGPIPQANGGLRVDLAGNLYLGMLHWPKGLPYPKGFEKSRAWRMTAGSVVKFDPKAGGYAEGDKRIMVAESFKGALAVYPGMAPFSRSGLGGNTCCVCRVPRFDVDRYGRLAMPNALTNCVRLVDNAGNLIVEIGRYGNFDSQFLNPVGEPGEATRPTVAVPAIPLGWPTGAGFSESHLYINDTQNRRVVRTDLTHRAEATAPIR